VSKRGPDAEIYTSCMRIGGERWGMLVLYFGEKWGQKRTLSSGGI